ncbi:MAG: Asp-tRNA(Asn)/Glu-tRNA(Gln) amidotransferase subunit GatB [Verrucomicrobiales bacterium]|jgi:aspartyl-tRNA(Asn)/glutamyl-tRNA(Gln) amidotransferase subunit B|nr:Asp-tRNA(Asn)/Glu-tRNA(Gln) amidotransferase subunit GatB [Verrucomicrobiales bacterium]
MKYEAIIGLEVHAQVKTNTKMFCGCKNEYGGAPNTHVCPVCLGLPGALPAPNAEAIRQTILTGLMLDCQIAEVCKFDRKNYFYPDQAKNYQITQYDLPLCVGGAVTLDKYAYPKEVQKEACADSGKKIRLNRIHLEEDVAKSTHFDTESGIDFNRCGTPLMEIVSEADLRTPEEAFAYLTTLKRILNYGKVSDADMEKGQLRCDVNVSVRPVGQEKFGTKCELKNLNTISGVRRALAYEIQRQIETVSQGGVITQETRRWDDAAGQTYVMRSKENAHDYRYFPDPDLLPVRTDQGLKTAAAAGLPELPRQKKARFVAALGLSEYQAEVLAADQALGDYFEAAAGESRLAPAVANYLINDFLATEPDTANIKIPAEHFSQLAALVADGKINSKQAKEVLAEMLAGSGAAPADIVQKHGLAQVTDLGALAAFCDEAMAANPKSVADYQSGKLGAINALKGFVMKKTKGQANPALVDEVLKKKLGS